MRWSSGDWTPSTISQDSPNWVQRLMRAWVWFGQRAVWLAAGVIFARLLASRTSLLIAEFEFMRATFTSTGLWQIIQSWLPK